MMAGWPVYENGGIEDILKACPKLTTFNINTDTYAVRLCPMSAIKDAPALPDVICAGARGFLCCVFCVKACCFEQLLCFGIVYLANYVPENSNHSQAHVHKRHAEEARTPVLNATRVTLSLLKALMEKPELQSGERQKNRELCEQCKACASELSTKKEEEGCIA